MGVSRQESSEQGQGCQEGLGWPTYGMPRLVGRVEGWVSRPTDWLSTPQLHSRVWGGSAELGGRSAGSSNRDPV